MIVAFLGIFTRDDILADVARAAIVAAIEGYRRDSVEMIAERDTFARTGVSIDVLLNSSTAREKLGADWMLFVSVQPHAVGPVKMVMVVASFLSATSSQRMKEGVVVTENLLSSVALQIPTLVDTLVERARPR